MLQDIKRKIEMVQYLQAKYFSQTWVANADPFKTQTWEEGNILYTVCGFEKKKWVRYIYVYIFL